MPKQYCYLLLFCLLSSLACHKDDEAPGLPPITSSGANTFGCLIDGKPWVAELDPGVFDPWIQKVGAKYDEIGVGVADNYYWSLRATYINLAADKKEDFLLYFRPVTNKGRVDLSQLARKDVYFYFGQPGIATQSSIYRLDTLYSANSFLLTRLDTVKNIGSGLFSFRLVRTDLQDTLMLTKGRFDVRYQPD